MIRYKNYIIEPNDCGDWILKEESSTINKKTGENYAYTICYPSTIKGCLTKILNVEFSRFVDSKENITLTEAIDKVESINKELTDFLNNKIKEEIK